MDAVAEALPDLDDLTWEDLEALGRWLTEQIGRADQVHDRGLVDELLRAKDRVNKLKARVA